MEEKETEIVETVASDEILAQAMRALKKNKRRMKISQICSITIPVILGIILIGFPIIMHNINVDKNNRYWKEMITQVNVDYTDLEKMSISSIQELNKEKKAQFYWLDNMTKTESYILTYNDKNVLIEEHYTYNDIECVLYIKKEKSTIKGIEINHKLVNKYIIKDNLYINYSSFEENTYGRLSSEYMYQFTINSTDTSTIETIFSNLTND
ncbi:MAG: hypothetical protein K2H06_05560 [Anaeroplasmataceae bacterium]|nr:hypothetical protein [Anaeroplasmataceae bacterium]